MVTMVSRPMASRSGRFILFLRSKGWWCSGFGIVLIRVGVRWFCYELFTAYIVIVSRGAIGRPKLQRQRIAKNS